MEHLRFKSEQTAAAYVADELDPAQREAFELHMMMCPECVEDVESWRAVKHHLPRDNGSREALPHESARQNCKADGPAALGDAHTGESTGPGGHTAHRDSRKGSSVSAARHGSKSTPAGSAGTSPPPPRRTTNGRWRLPSAVAASLLAGTVGGWYVRSVRGPSVEADHIGFYSLPPLARGPADCMSLQLRPGVSLIVLRIPGAVPNQQLVPVDSEGHDLAPSSYSVQIQGDASWLVRLPAATVRQQGIRFEARSPDGTVEPRGCVISAAQS